MKPKKTDCMGRYQERYYPLAEVPFSFLCRLKLRNCMAIHPKSNLTSVSYERQQLIKIGLFLLLLAGLMAACDNASERSIPNIFSPPVYRRGISST
jgi:hypothetical protein